MGFVKEKDYDSLLQFRAIPLGIYSQLFIEWMEPYMRNEELYIHPSIYDVIV